MASLKELADSRGSLLNFDPRKLLVKPDLNARNLAALENQEHIEWLADSIAQQGVKVPLTVFLEGDKVFVADGHCRLAATMLAISKGADILTVPCISEGRGTNDVDRVLAQNIFNSGKRLTPIEQGVNFKKALALGATVAQIAERVGKSTGYVNQMLNFQSAPIEAHQLVADGHVSATLAAKVIRENGPETGLEKLKEAVTTAKTEGKTRATEKHLDQPSDPLWGSVVAWMRSHMKRPEGLDDEDVSTLLDYLTELMSVAGREDIELVTVTEED